MLILTSSSNFVTKRFLSDFPRSPQGMHLTFITTASEVEVGDLQWLNDDRQVLIDAGFAVSDYTITGKSRQEVQQMLDQTDVVFVAGGNTFFLLQEMRKSGFAELIHDYIHKGMIYIGSSAGSVVAGPTVRLVDGLDDPADAPELQDFAGLELIDIAILPHWGSPKFQRRYQQVIPATYTKGLKVLPLTDDQYLLVDQGKYTIESIV
jgi:dipeptidase E